MMGAPGRTALAARPAAMSGRVRTSGRRSEMRSIAAKVTSTQARIRLRASTPPAGTTAPAHPNAAIVATIMAPAKREFGSGAYAAANRPAAHPAGPPARLTARDHGQELTASCIAEPNLDRSVEPGAIAMPRLGVYCLRSPCRPRSGGTADQTPNLRRWLVRPIEADTGIGDNRRRGVASLWRLAPRSGRGSVLRCTTP